MYVNFLERIHLRPQTNYPIFLLFLRAEGDEAGISGDFWRVMHLELKCLPPFFSFIFLKLAWVGGFVKP